MSFQNIKLILFIQKKIKERLEILSMMSIGCYAGAYQEFFFKN